MTTSAIERRAFGLIDAQAGFMPEEEGKRLGAEGFGELPVPDGQSIIAPTNRLLAAYAVRGFNTFTMQDWHADPEEEKIHFSDQPDFQTSWPVHCVAGKPGAELHPELALPIGTERFYKGVKPLKPGEPDLSYSGFYAENEVGLTLPAYLREQKVEKVDLGGLALDYCLGKTAIDLTLDGFEVTVVTDTTRGIAENSIKTMLAQFAEHGIVTMTSDELLARQTLNK